MYIATEIHLKFFALGTDIYKKNKQIKFEKVILLMQTFSN